MKKLEVHVFPGKTSSGKSFSFSLSSAIVFVLCVVAAVLGYILFSPLEIMDNLSNGNVVDVYRQNKAVEQEIKEIRALVDTSILKIEETKLVKDSTMRAGGLGFTLENTAAMEEKLMQEKSLSDIEETFKRVLKKLEGDSALAAKVPVLHPLKGHHSVKTRFEMIFDPFTEQELPHRGIDYVADEGDTVYATGAGTVIESRRHRGFGETLKIEHMKGIRTFYAHLGDALVSTGDKVYRGMPIAIIGKSGLESSLGLHYEIRLNGVPVNPEDYFITK